MSGFSLSEYVDGIYLELNDKTMEANCIKLLGMSHTPLKEYMSEIIYSNIYEALLIMHQLLTHNALKQEHFLQSLSIDSAIWGQVSERIRKRLQQKPPHSTRSFIKAGEYTDGVSQSVHFYTPKIVKAYNEVIFVPRETTNILDISKEYQDIAAYLFYEDENNYANSEYMKNKELIKSYRLWNFKKSTFEHLVEIYNRIDKGKGDRFAQRLFIEKMFAVATVSYLQQRDYVQQRKYSIAGCICGMSGLGFSRLHKYIIEKITVDNALLIQDTIDEYIYPLCSECISMSVNGIIKYLERLKYEMRLYDIVKYISSCKRFLTKSPLMQPITDITSYAIHDSVIDLTTFILYNYKFAQLQHKDYKLNIIKNYWSDVSNSYKEITKARTKSDKEHTLYIYDYGIRNGLNNEIIKGDMSEYQDEESYEQMVKAHKRFKY